ncbi:MAG: hypothetical protein ACTSVV_16365 [Promethearchaeota archaeon]
MSPKEITKVDITNEVFKEPIEVIKQLNAHIDGLKYTKVIQTFVMEERRLNLQLEKDGTVFFRGKIVWIGNKKDDTEGTIFCVDSRNELKQINPTPENTESVFIDVKKDTIIIKTSTKSQCAVCGKPIEIFDSIARCPSCDTRAHKEHLIDWIKMKHSCPVCKEPLEVSPTGAIILK